MFVDQNHLNWKQTTENKNLIDTINIEKQKKMQSEAQKLEVLQVKRIRRDFARNINSSIL